MTSSSLTDETMNVLRIRNKWWLILYISCLLIHGIVSVGDGNATADGPPEEESCSADIVNEKLQNDVRSCSDIICLVSSLVTDTSFRKDHWERKPLLLHLQPSALGPALLDWEGLVATAEREGGLQWTGTPTGNSVLRSKGMGVPPNIQAGAMMLRRDMQEGAKHSFVILSALQTVHRGVATLVQEFQQGLGMPVNANAVATKGGSRPPKTERVDQFVVQTVGRRRWKVYQPLPEVEMAVWGVHGKAEWGAKEPGGIPPRLLGERIVDIILGPGDILYIPRGFPHSTSPPQEKLKDHEDDDDDENDDHYYNDGAEQFGTPDVHVTLLAHTEAQHYVYEKLLRCTLARSGFCDEKIPGIDDKFCPVGLLLTKYVRSDVGKDLRRALPIGFLHGNGKWFDFVQPLASVLQTHVQKLEKLVDKRVKEGGGDFSNVHKDLPTVAGRILDASKQDIPVLEETFEGTTMVSRMKRQDHWQKVFGELGPFQGDYCHKGGPQVFFHDYFSQENEIDKFTKRMLS